MFALVICLILLICAMTIRSFVLCVLMEGMFVVTNVMLSVTSVIAHPLACATNRCARW